MSDPEHRSLFLEERIAKIKSELTQHSPKIVIMYGLGEANAWKEIVGQALRPEAPARIGDTVFALASHPQTRGTQECGLD